MKPPEDQGQERVNRPRVPGNLSIQGPWAKYGAHGAFHAADSIGGRPVPSLGRQRPRRVIPAPPKAGGGVASRRANPRKGAHLDADPDKADDEAYVDSIYREVEAAIQAGMDRLAKRRSFPIFG